LDGSLKLFSTLGSAETTPTWTDAGSAANSARSSKFGAGTGKRAKDPGQHLQKASCCSSTMPLEAPVISGQQAKPSPLQTHLFRHGFSQVSGKINHDRKNFKCLAKNLGPASIESDRRANLSVALLQQLRFAQRPERGQLAQARPHAGCWPDPGGPVDGLRRVQAAQIRRPRAEKAESACWVIFSAPPLAGALEAISQNSRGHRLRGWPRCRHCCSKHQQARRHTGLPMGGRGTPLPDHGGR